MECPQYKGTIDIINAYILPIITVFGIIGNFFTSLFFLSSQLKNKSSSIYLGALSVTDLGFLLTLLVTLLNYNDYFDIYNLNGFCQLTLYVSTVCSNLSVWLIVAFTTERFIAVKYPLQRVTVCTVRRARKITFSLVLFTCVCHIYLFWSAGIVEDFARGRRICEMKMDYEKFMEIVHYLDATFVLVIPFCVIVSLNVRIARAILVFREKLFLSQFEESVSSGNGSKMSSESDHRATSRENSDNLPKGLQLCTVFYERRIQMAKGQRNITKIFLISSTVFLMLNAPSYAIRLILFTCDRFQWKFENNSLCFYQQLAIFLYYTNFSVNFLLYSMCGSAFRKALYIFLLNGIRKIRPSGRACRNDLNHSWRFSVHFEK